MRRYIRLQDVVNDFRLSQNHPLEAHKVWVFVEGDNDVRLWKKLFHGENVKLNAVNGNLYVRDIVKSINRIPYENAFGIVDADFSRLQTHSGVEQNIFYTDCHDVEMMAIFTGRVFEHVTFDCWQKKINYVAQRNEILQSITFIGVTRKYSLDKNVHLELSDFPVHICCDFGGNGHIMFDAKKFVQVANKRSPQKTRDIRLEEIEDEIKQMTMSQDNLKELCNGHDFAKVWRKWLQHESNKNISLEHLESLLFMAFNFHEFCLTNLYKDLENWANAHRYTIFDMVKSAQIVPCP